MSDLIQVAVLSDTHGLIRPELESILEGKDWILHVGDFGSQSNLDYFKRKDCSFAGVKGNVDRGLWASGLPESQWIEVGGVSVYMIHNIEELDLDPAAADISLVLFGHSHKPEDNQKNGVRFLNPGSMGPKRFHLPICMSILTIDPISSTIREVKNIQLPES